jgi:sporulation protein YlmC with PRC-barrel domain
MVQVERIDEWRGQEVVDSAGESLGKLEDVYFRGESDEAVIASVRSGRLLKRSHLVPLGGASFSRDYVRVTHGAGQVDDAPDPPDDGVVNAELAGRVAGHYGVEIPAEVYEGSQARSDRLARATEARERAQEHEEAAGARLAEAEAARHQAEQLGHDATTAEAAAEDARRAAAEAHAEAEHVERPPGAE